MPQKNGEAKGVTNAFRGKERAKEREGESRLNTSTHAGKKGSSRSRSAPTRARARRETTQNTHVGAQLQGMLTRYGHIKVASKRNRNGTNKMKKEQPQKRKSEGR